MWQHHYVIHSMRMAELLAAAERERRWRRQDEANGRRIPSRDPGRARAVAARLAAAASRLAARAAHRLDGRVPVDVGHERLLRDA